MGEINHCKNCGAKLNENDKFCTNCGAAVDGLNESDSGAGINQTDTENAFDHEQRYAEGATESSEGSEVNTEEYTEKPDESTGSPEGSKSHTSRNVLITFVAVAFVVIAFGLGVYCGNNHILLGTSTAEENQEDLEKEETYEEDMTMDEIFSDPEQVNPRDFAAYVYNQIVQGKLSGEEYWDYYVSEESDSYVIKSEFVNCFDNAQKYSKTIGYLSINYVEIDDDDNENEGEDGDENKEEYRVLGTVQSLSSSDELTTTQTYDYVVVEDGKYKFDVTNHNDSIFNF